MRFSAVIFPAAVAMTAGFRAPALAQDSPTVRRVTFRDGRAVIHGALKGDKANDYVFPAGAGESIRIDLRTNRKSNYFNVTGPGADSAMFVGSTSGSSFEGVAPTSGDYTARVYLMRSDARRGVAASYTLTITLGRQNAAVGNGPDFADGMAGGPDTWKITGVPAGDTLAVRETPSPNGRLVAQFPDGTDLRNLGCRNTRGQRWCQVEDSEHRRGWANGRYLRER